MIAKLSSGDLVAIEAKYHFNCLSAYKSQHRSFIRSQKSNDNEEEKQQLARAFAELVAFIESSVENGNYIFKLSELHSLFEDRLCALSLGISINKTTSLIMDSATSFTIFYLLLQCALLQHSNRALYQASIWTICPREDTSIPLPEGFGWKRSEDSYWVPIWTLLPEIAKASRDLIKCSCKAEPLCSRRCKCQGAGLPCTALCQCGGTCA